MSAKQHQAVWELRRQGYQITAEHAARAWGQGEHFDLGNEPALSRLLEDLIDQCNWEVERDLEHA
jgi:hypothetical protein